VGEQDRDRDRDRQWVSVSFAVTLAQWLNADADDDTTWKGKARWKILNTLRRCLLTADVNLLLPLQLYLHPLNAPALGLFNCTWDRRDWNWELGTGNLDLNLNLNLGLERRNGERASEDRAAIKIECKLRMHKTLIFMKPYIVIPSPKYLDPSPSFTGRDVMAWFAGGNNA